MTDLLRSLDAEVSNVLGNKVVGWETCTLYDGAWSIMIGTDADGWAIQAEVSPFYKAYDHFEYDEEDDGDDPISKAFYEKYKECILNFEVVPRYSTDVNEALKAWQSIYDNLPNKENYTLQITQVSGSWSCALYKGDPANSEVLIRSGGNTLAQSLCILMVATGNVRF